ncbi:MAG: CPBP family intramembrane metalloprotease [Chloroflexi bacterium]|nr:CPBP family intramembrane metalloprotease [Chloroflexota bacterium]
MGKSFPSSTGRRTIRDQVARHPMIAFIALAYAISWIAWSLSLIDLGVAYGFGVIFSAGPALAAMIVSALLRPEQSGVPAGKRWRLFGIVGILVLAVMAVRRLWITPAWLTVAGNVTTTAPYPTLVAFLVDALGAAVAAFVLSGVYSPRQGVRALLRSLDMRDQPVRWYWWVLAVGLYPVILALGNAISAGLGLAVPAPISTGLWYQLALDVLLTFLYLLFGGGGLEEPGWRGFALPLLKKRYGPLRSSLILAVVWAFWHWPLFWSQGAPLNVVFYLLLEVAPLAILFTAILNRTGGSLPIVILLHSSINIAPIFLPVSLLNTILWILLSLGVALWMWRAPQAFAVREAPSRPT